MGGAERAPIMALQARRSPRYADVERQCERSATERAQTGFIAVRPTRLQHGALVAAGCTMLHRASVEQRCPSSIRRGAPGTQWCVCVRACERARHTPQHGIAARSRWRCRALRGPPAQGTRSAVFTVKAAPPPRRSYDATCSGGAGPPGNMDCAACRAEDGVRRRGERTPTRPCCVRAMHRRGNDARETRAAYSISALTR